MFFGLVFKIYIILFNVIALWAGIA